MKNPIPPGRDGLASQPRRSMTALGVLTLALAASMSTLPPVYAAEQGPTFCPMYNPDALTNTCFESHLDTLDVRAPDEVGVTGQIPVCIIGNICVNVTKVGVTEYQTVTVGPTLFIDEFWIEATVLCDFVPQCRVTIVPMDASTFRAKLGDLDHDYVLDSLVVNIDDAWYLFSLVR